MSRYKIVFKAIKLKNHSEVNTLIEREASAIAKKLLTNK